MKPGYCAKTVCQGCGKEIKGGENAVKVHYGVFGYTAHPHAVIRGKRIDYFHQTCEKAFKEAI